METKNVGAIHTECADDRQRLWQEKNFDKRIKAGNMVKIGFPFSDGDLYKLEYMWVGVLMVPINRGVMTGRLCNDPMYADFEYGDWIKFKFSEICDWTEE